MSRLGHIWFLMLKDLRLFARDRFALLFYILFPFLFVILFNFVLGGTAAQDPRLTLHVVTREASGLSQQIIAAMETKDPSLLKPGEPRIVWDKDYGQARQDVQDKKLPGFLAFPEDFTRSISMGYGTRLEIVVDPEETYIRAALGGLARSIASQVSSQQVARSAAIGLVVEQAISSGNYAGIGQDMQNFLSGQGSLTVEKPFINYTIEKVGEVKKDNPSDYVIPGYLVMFVFFGAALSAEAIVRERRNQTLERLLAGSVKRESVIGGIFAGIAAKGLIQILIFWGVGILAFHIDLGQSPAAVIILSLLMVLVSSAFAVMLAAFARTERSAGSVAVITSLVLAPLGGSWWPLFIVPRWMQSIARLTPHGWANTGFNKLMLFGGDFASSAPEMLALLGFAIVFGIIAIQRFRTSAL